MVPVQPAMACGAAGRGPGARAGLPPRPDLLSLSSVEPQGLLRGAMPARRLPPGRAGGGGVWQAVALTGGVQAWQDDGL
ncbi:hypothetical protein O3P69_012859 [Scylla paramamosain]|uniref:Uncharacterized protein n=1 Tax=Scylla paramamosain TaxID=85552 RepID=A0AAW0TRE1_SCYPA